MFLGHYAAAMAAKRIAPQTSLGSLTAAALSLDLIWPVLVIAGAEHVAVDPRATAFTPLDFQHYPWSHSLLTSAGLGAAFCAMYFAWRRYAAGAMLIALLAVSHWLLDAPMHRPDLPLTPWGDTRVGFALWNNVPVTLAIELGLLASGAALYLGATQPRHRSGTIAAAAFLLTLVLVYAGASFGPPPPDAQAVAWSANLQWLFVLFAWWVDRTRAARTI